MRLLLIAPYFAKDAVGESWSTYQWVKHLAEKHCVTVITTHPAGWNPATSPTAAENIINWPDPQLPKQFARLARELKPGYLLFYYRTRRWLKQNRNLLSSFDFIHQINPLAPRYPSPAVGLGVPYIIGPIAGGIPTPNGFRKECAERQWYRRLRSLDQYRLRHDPMLRRTFLEAEAVVGVAPYVKDILGSIPLKDFASIAETGPLTLQSRQSEPFDGVRTFRALFVGRIIRTKGVLDAIRAIAIARGKNLKIDFDIIGEGDSLAACQAEVNTLGLGNHINFHGRLPREEIDQWYRKSDVFLFPSFREPSGNVVFEALSYGLPVITASNGGPGHVVNSSCGFTVAPSNPHQYPQDLAKCLIQLFHSPSLCNFLNAGAHARMVEVGLWSARINEMNAVYDRHLRHN